MRRTLVPRAVRVLAALLLIGPGANTTDVYAKHKNGAVDPNDSTLRLFQLLDSSYGGKLADYYLLGDIYKNPQNPSEELQHVLRVDYDKNSAFGRLKIHVRSVGKLQPDQLKVYTPKMVYEFGVADAEKFVKTDPGPFGKADDLYMRSTDDRPLASAPATEEVQKAYDHLVTDYVLPALQKK